jgi:hypothetical protein
VDIRLFTSVAISKDGLFIKTGYISSRFVKSRKTFLTFSALALVAGAVISFVFSSLEQEVTQDLA